MDSSNEATRERHSPLPFQANKSASVPLGEVCMEPPSDNIAHNLQGDWEQRNTYVAGLQVGYESDSSRDSGLDSLGTRCKCACGKQEFLHLMNPPRECSGRRYNHIFPSLDLTLPMGGDRHQVEQAQFLMESALARDTEEAEDAYAIFSLTVYNSLVENPRALPRLKQLVRGKRGGVVTATSTFDELYDQATAGHGFINYQSLEILVKQCSGGDRELQQALEEYETAYRKFAAHRVYLFPEGFEAIRRPIQEGYLELKIKVEENYRNFPIERHEKFKQVTKKILKLEENVGLHVRTVKEGCVEITFEIPKQDADKAFSMELTLEQKRELAANNISLLECNSIIHYCECSLFEDEASQQVVKDLLTSKTHFVDIVSEEEEELSQHHQDCFYLKKNRMYDCPHDTCVYCWESFPRCTLEYHSRVCDKYKEDLKDFSESDTGSLCSVDSNESEDVEDTGLPLIVYQDEDQDEAHQLDTKTKPVLRCYSIQMFDNEVLKVPPPGADGIQSKLADTTMESTNTCSCSPRLLSLVIFLVLLLPSSAIICYTKSSKMSIENIFVVIISVMMVIILFFDMCLLLTLISALHKDSCRVKPECHTRATKSSAGYFGLFALLISMVSLLLFSMSLPSNVMMETRLSSTVTIMTVLNGTQSNVNDFRELTARLTIHKCYSVAFDRIRTTFREITLENPSLRTNLDLEPESFSLDLHNNTITINFHLQEIEESIFNDRLKEIEESNFNYHIQWSFNFHLQEIEESNFSFHLQEIEEWNFNLHLQEIEGLRQTNSELFRPNSLRFAYNKDGFYRISADMTELMRTYQGGGKCIVIIVVVTCCKLDLFGETTLPETTCANRNDFEPHILEEADNESERKEKTKKGSDVNEEEYCDRNIDCNPLTLTFD